VAVVVAQSSGPANWEFRLRIGARLDLLTTSSGQTLLAFQEPERRHETMAIWGSLEHAKHLSDLEPSLGEIRALGYRIGDSLQLVGVRDISVPVLGPTREALAVLTCPYLQHIERANPAPIETALARLREVAEALSIGQSV
jgi:DNA-binding IclR family transcriptional regulator